MDLYPEVFEASLFAQVTVIASGFVSEFFHYCISFPAVYLQIQHILSHFLLISIRIVNFVLEAYPALDLKEMRILILNL